MKALAETTKEQSIVEIFSEMMDQIYYPGYTEEIIASDPEKFDWEPVSYTHLTLPTNYSV